MAATKKSQQKKDNPMWKGGPPIKTCLQCGKSFIDKKYNHKPSCCGYSCAALYRWKDKANIVTCKTCKKQFKSQPFYKRTFCSHKCFGINQRLKPKDYMKGRRNHKWKGGITPINLRDRYSLEYKIWRTAVFMRDNFTCVHCGDAKGGNLEADHIKPFAFYPELRFAIDNGRTLCHSCHIKTHTYGNYKFFRQNHETKQNCFN